MNMARQDDFRQTVDYTAQIESILGGRDFKFVSRWTNPVTGAIGRRYERGFGPKPSYAVVHCDEHGLPFDVYVCVLEDGTPQSTHQLAADFVANRPVKPPQAVVAQGLFT